MKDSQKDSENQTEKIKRFGILDWVILIISALFAPYAIVMITVFGIIGFLTDHPEAIGQTVAGVVLLFLASWGIRAKLLKAKETKTPQKYKIVLVLTVSILVIMLLLFFLPIFLVSD